MRTAVIAFREKNGYFPEAKLNDVIEALNSANFSADEIAVIVGEKKLFIEVFEKCRQAYDNVLVLDCERNDFELTQAIEGCDKINCIFKSDNADVLFVSDNVKTKKVVEDVFLPFLKGKEGRSFGKVVFKVFGLTKEEIQTKLAQIGQDLEVAFNIVGDGLDNKVEIIYDDKSTKMDYDACQKRFLDEFSDCVYAEYDVGIEQRLVDLLKLRNCVLSTAESFTGGNVASSVISVSGASEVFYEGIVAYDSEAKIDRLGVERVSIVKAKPVSAQVAGEMAKGLFKSGKTTVTLSTTGIAGPNSDDSKFPVGLCYFGVGYKGKVKVYKYEFEGDRETVIKNGTKTALFLAIKRLKEL